VFIHFNSLCEFTFFFIEASILFLFFAELASCFKKSLEIILVSFVFEKVYLSEKLLLLLLELSNFLFKFIRVH
jgi:hypothetical protein